MSARLALLLALACTSKLDDPAGGSSSGPAPLCVPGMSVPCACAGGEAGAQICEAHGQAFGPCACTQAPTTSGAGDTSSGANAPSSTTVDASSSSTDEPPSSTSFATTGTDTTAPGSSDGSTTALLCDAGEEPNDDLATAQAVEGLRCSEPPSTFSGILDGSLDVDWFNYIGGASKGSCGLESPTPTHLLTAPVGVRLCVYHGCDNPPAAEVTCLDGAQADMFDSLPGCCDQGDIRSVVHGPNGGREPGDETTWVWVRVDLGPQDTCAEYQVEYRYGPIP